MRSRHHRLTVVHHCIVVLVAIGQLALAADARGQGEHACPVITDVRVAFPTSVPDAAECSGPASNFTRPSSQLPEDQQEELHIIGVYEAVLPDGAPRGSDDHPQGTIRVAIHPTAKPVALVLAAYEPIRWQLALDDGARLSRVLTQGYCAQDVVGVPVGVNVTHIGRDEVCDHAYGWEPRHHTSAANIVAMLDSLRARTGLIERSFQGCYAGTALDVPYWSASRRPTSPFFPETRPSLESACRPPDAKPCRPRRTATA